MKIHTGILVTALSKGLKTTLMHLQQRIKFKNETSFIVLHEHTGEIKNIWT